MAIVTAGGIAKTWAGLKENPVFRRTLLPRGFRSILRSPIARAVLLTAVALAVYEMVTGATASLVVIVASGIIFWFLIEAVQHYFGWLELTMLARDGTLDDYLNSGLSRADVAIGVIYTAVISEAIAVIGVLAWFLISDRMGTDLSFKGLLVVVIFLRVRGICRPPFLFHPNTEGYLRKRNPLSLFFIGFAVLVPLLMWFAILIPMIYLVIYLDGLAGMPLRGGNITIVAVVVSMILSRWPSRWFARWRLKRFYRRYQSFDDLFERYIEQGERDAPRG